MLVGESYWSITRLCTLYTDLPAVGLCDMDVQSIRRSEDVDEHRTRGAFAFGVFGRTTHVLVADIEMDVLLILFCKSEMIAQCPFCSWSRFLLCVVCERVCVNKMSHFKRNWFSGWRKHFKMYQTNDVLTLSLIEGTAEMWRVRWQCEWIYQYTYNRANGRRLLTQKKFARRELAGGESANGSLFANEWRVLCCLLRTLNCCFARWRAAKDLLQEIEQPWIASQREEKSTSNAVNRFHYQR